MFCTKCGQEIHDNSAFCSKCGNAVEHSANQANTGQGSPVGSNAGNPYGAGYQARGYQPQRPSNAPGKTLLTVVGILLLIGGIISIVSCFMSLSVIQLASWFGGGSLYLWWVVDLVYAFCTLIGGIGCILFSGKPDKADKVILIGLAIIVLRILDWILIAALLSGLVASFTAAGAVFGFIIPILVMVGGWKNKNATHNTGYSN